MTKKNLYFYFLSVDSNKKSTEHTFLFSNFPENKRKRRRGHTQSTQSTNNHHDTITEKKGDIFEVSYLIKKYNICILNRRRIYMHIPLQVNSIFFF